MCIYVLVAQLFFWECFLCFLVFIVLSFLSHLLNSLFFPPDWQLPRHGALCWSGLCLTVKPPLLLYLQQRSRANKAEAHTQETQRKACFPLLQTQSVISQLRHCCCCWHCNLNRHWQTVYLLNWGQILKISTFKKHPILLLCSVTSKQAWFPI